MNTSIEKMPTASYSNGRVYVSLPSGVDFSFPIAGNWRLEDAKDEQLCHMEIDNTGIHWPDLDEDLSFEGLLQGDYGQYIRRRPMAMA